jgi:hypothetical protein
MKLIVLLFSLLLAMSAIARSAYHHNHHIPEAPRHRIEEDSDESIEDSDVDVVVKPQPEPQPQFSTCHELCGTGIYTKAGECQQDGRCLCAFGWTGDNANFVGEGPHKGRILADHCTQRK